MGKIEKSMISIYVQGILIYILFSVVYDNESTLIGLFVFFIGAILISLIFLNLLKLNMSINASLIALLSITMPISFRSVFGNSFAEMPVPWFYMILLILLIYTIISNNKFNKLLLILALMFTVSLVPSLLLSKNYTEGFKEFLTYMTFANGIIIASGFNNKLTHKEYRNIIKLYIFAVLCSSIGIIVQYIVLKVKSVALFSTDYFGGGRVLLRFLFADMSGATIYIATGVIILILVQIKYRSIFSIIMILGMALTSSRAGLIVLILTVLLIIIFTGSFIKKLKMFISLLLVGGLGLFVLFLSRKNIDTLYGLIFNDTGRIETIKATLEKNLENPFFGNGLDLGAQISSSGGTVAHFALVQFFGQTGIFATVILILILVLIYFKSLQNLNIELKWIYILCILGSFITPSFFSMRFFTIIILLIILAPTKLKGEEYG